jgi:hypothetical protein
VQFFKIERQHEAISRKFRSLLGIFYVGFAQAAVISFTAVLSGPAKVTVNSSPGVGTASIVFNTTAHSLSVNVVFGGLQGTTKAIIELIEA